MFEFTLPDIALDISLLLIRIILSIVFIIGAKNKLSKIKKFAKSNGLPIPIATFVAIGELLGGIGLAFGILSQLAATGIMLLMLNTMTIHIFKWHSPYWASKGGWEYDLTLFALTSVILILGAGQFSLM